MTIEELIEQLTKIPNHERDVKIYFNGDISGIVYLRAVEDDGSKHSIWIHTFPLRQTTEGK